MTADSPIFGSVEEFMAWDIKTTDASSLTVRAIHLYQNILKFHKEDKDQSAFLDANLDRLQFGYNKANPSPLSLRERGRGEGAVGDDKAARYKAALQKSVERWADHETSARARFLWASVLQQEGDLARAHKVASQGVDTFPDSVGGKMCFNLMKQIEAKEVQVNTERVWNAPWPVIQVRYRNITKVNFRLVRDDWSARAKMKHYPPEALRTEEHKALVAKKPEQAWAVELPATKDYQQRTEEVALAQGHEARILLPAGQSRSQFRRAGQRGRVHGHLGEQPGPGYSLALE